MAKPGKDTATLDQSWWTASQVSNLRGSKWKEKLIFHWSNCSLQVESHWFQQWLGKWNRWLFQNVHLIFEAFQTYWQPLSFLRCPGLWQKTGTDELLIANISKIRKLMKKTQTKRQSLYLWEKIFWRFNELTINNLTNNEKRVLENWSEWYQWKKHFRQKTIINQNSYDFKKKIWNWKHWNHNVKSSKVIILLFQKLVKATRTTTYSAVMELRGWPTKGKIDSFFICIALFF